MKKKTLNKANNVLLLGAFSLIIPMMSGYYVLSHYKSGLNLNIAFAIGVNLMYALLLYILFRMYTKMVDECHAYNRDLEYLLDIITNDKWKLNPNTGLIDVDGDVNFSRINDDFGYFFNRNKAYLEIFDKGELPYNFGIVNGSFIVGLFGCTFKSIKGFPKIIKDICIISDGIEVFDWKPESVNVLKVMFHIIPKKYHEEIITSVRVMVDGGSIIALHRDLEAEIEMYYQCKLAEVI